MKRTVQIIMTVAIMAMVASCGGKHQFHIDGMIADEQFEGHMVYLYESGELMDSAVVTDGGFVFDGKVENPWIGTLYALGDGARAQLYFIVEAGNINVDMLEDVMGGTPLNDSLYAFLQADDNEDLEEELKTYLQLYYSAPTPEVRAQAEHLYDSVEAIGIGRTFDRAMSLYERNSDNVLGAYAMGAICSTNRLSYDELNAMVEKADPVVKEYKPVADKLSQLRAVKQTSAGMHYIDVEGVDGKLSDLIDGRLALVDFYASWCGPCRAEIRDNLVPLWAKYQDKGIVIVGLNVWERGDKASREAAHQKVMADLGITYPQLVDSTRTATDTYGVQGIPQIMLIGPDGTILARDLRGAAIEEAIVNALGK